MQKHAPWLPVATAKAVNAVPPFNQDEYLDPHSAANPNPPGDGNIIQSGFAGESVVLLAGGCSLFQFQFSAGENENTCTKKTAYHRFL